MVAVLVVALGILLVVIAFSIVIDGVKQVIVDHGPEAVKYITKKIEKK